MSRAIRISLLPYSKAARGVDIPGRDHNRAVGDKVYKDSVLNFLNIAPDCLGVKVAYIS